MNWNENIQFMAELHTCIFLIHVGIKLVICFVTILSERITFRSTVEGSETRGC